MTNNPKRFNIRSLLPCDTRIALGSRALRPGQPAECCAYCWPALIAADKYDTHGHACCLHCAGNPDRERKLPGYSTDAWRMVA